MSANQRSRAWCVTLFRDDLSVENWAEIASEAFSGAKYSVRQLERAPETGKLHIQGFCYFENAKTFSSMKKLFSASAHLESSKGTPEQNKEYCTKQDSRVEDTQPIEVGECPKSGKRTDLEGIAEEIVGGASIQSVALANPVAFIRYHRGFTALSLISQKPRDFMTKLVVYYGPTGSGKSTRVRQELAGQSYFQLTKAMASGSTVWWDGYDPIVHKSVVMDDFYGWIPLHTFLNIVDSHPMTVQTKGGSVQFRAETVYITSNAAPDQWYKNVIADTPAQAAAFNRRCMPPWGSVSLVGYGPEKKDLFCKCNDEKCPLEHAEKPCNAAFAVGFKRGLN